MGETIATPQKLAVSVLIDTVRVEFMCGDEYAAQVLYDDIMDRLRAGEGLTISLQQPLRALRKETGDE